MGNNRLECEGYLRHVALDCEGGRLASHNMGWRFSAQSNPGGYRGSLTPISTGALGTVMTENAFWIARFPHGSLPADISVSIPLQNGHKRANGFLMPGGATVRPGVCQDLGDSLRLTALTEDLKLRFDRSYRIPFFLPDGCDPQSGSRAICSILSGDKGYLVRTLKAETRFLRAELARRMNIARVLSGSTLKVKYSGLEH